MKKIKMIVIAVVAMMMAGFAPVALAAGDSSNNSSSTTTYSCPTSSTRAGETVSNLALCNTPKDSENGGGLMNLVQTIINVVLSVVGIVAVLVVIIGGITYTTSLGDPGKTKKAKDTILYGIVGMVIALLAFAIVNFVLSAL